MFRALLESAPDAMVIVNGMGAMVLVNGQAERLFGYPREELIGQPVELLVPQSHQAQHEQKQRGYLADPRVRSMGSGLELCGRRKDGTEFPAEISLSPLKTAQGVLVSAAVRDVSERRQAEQALHASEERFRLLVEGVKDYAIYMLDPEGQVVSWNEGAQAIKGYRAEEIIGCHFSRFFTPEDLERGKPAEALRVAAAAGRWEEDGWRLRRDGSRFCASALLTAVRGERGRLLGFVKVTRDITERKRAEERLTRANAELSRSDQSLKRALEALQVSHEELKAAQLQLIQAARLESVGTLAAGVAHEVKNPLQTILMGLDFLSQKVPAGNEDVRLSLIDMRDAVLRADSIVRELLQLSAATEFKRKPEDLNVVIERSLRLIHNELIASQINVLRDLATALPPVQIDSGRIEQVCINLFINAIHAMAGGGTLTVRTRTVRLGEDLASHPRLFRQYKTGDHLVVTEVQDTGTGIPEENLAKIFDPFFTTKEVGVGTGMGLTVVKKIVDLHGGAIEIRNAPPGGALVTMILKVG